jgi:hypothetical protein
MLLARILVCALNRGRRQHPTAHTMLGEGAELISEVTARERANLHVRVCAVRGTMDCEFEFYPPGDVTKERLDHEMTAPGESKNLKGVTPGEVLTADIAGRPVECALYSKMPVTSGEHGDKKFWLEGKTLDELRLHLLSGPRPEPLLFEFDSKRYPEQFEWSDAPSDLVEHWPRNPPSPLAWSPARLKSSVLGKL